MGILQVQTGKQNRDKEENNWNEAIMTQYERFEFLEIDDVQTTSCNMPILTNTQTATAKKRRLIVDQVIGKFGAKAGEFNCPAGLYVDRFGNLYVADSYNHRIQRISPDGKVTAIGRHGSKPGEFTNPQDIYVDNDLTMYVLEQVHAVYRRLW